ncbi:MAG: hypothetical protein LUC47_06270, partial [Clostridiales bacterium]|nr:hypothetical protein [Clostridiales bacterium]
IILLMVKHSNHKRFLMRWTVAQNRSACRGGFAASRLFWAVGSFLLTMCIIPGFAPVEQMFF